MYKLEAAGAGGVYLYWFAYDHRLAPLRDQFRSHAHRAILGVDVARGHHHGIVRRQRHPDLARDTRLAISVAERWRIPWVPT